MDAAGSDYSKSRILPPGDQQLRQDRLRDTTAALKNQGLIPDAVVIAGDVTYQDDPKGWDFLPSILAPLHDGGLPEEHVVITPGNHDVTRNLAVGDPGHYQHFLAKVPSAWKRPLLDGKDFNELGKITEPTKGRYLLLPRERLVIVPINSSHYCGVREPFEWLSDDEQRALLELLKSENRVDLISAVDGLRERVDKFGERDPVRVSPNQMRALTELSDEINAEAAVHDIRPADLTRVAVMHHPTLPVTVSEEFKPFESLPNLAQVRLFLAGTGFHVLLHGHKHAGTVYTDHIAHFSQQPVRTDQQKRLLVVSGPTLTGEQGQTQAMALLDVETPPLRRTVRITNVPPATLGSGLPQHLPFDEFRLWEEDMRAVAPLVLSGQNTAEVYERVRAAFGDDRTVLRDLMCIVERPDNADQIPETYPDNLQVSGPEARQQWFTDIVRWWQRPDSQLLDKLHFSHGQRLKRYPAAEAPIDQIQEAGRALIKDGASTRAVLTLTDPERDQIASTRGFPAFLLVHATLRTEPSGTFLDLLAIYRKQEMRYWWPINVAELAVIQQELHGALSQPDVALGRLVTVSSVAHVGTEVPAVNVALIDRLADEPPAGSKIWAMAYSVAHPAAAPDMTDLWNDVLEDLTPAPASSRVSASVVGLPELLYWLGQFGDVGQAAEIRAGIQSLYETLEKVADDDLTPFWREMLCSTVDRIRTAVQAAGSVPPVGDTSNIATPPVDPSSPHGDETKDPS